jgi:O-acetylhomoserine/O-acetylserine sulfhydrylase-like pyridoxal-dependent enzyme
MFESRMAALEGTEDGFATASGMAAVSGALMSMLRAGDRVVVSARSSAPAFTCLEEVLRRYGVDVAFVDGTDLDQWRAAVRPGTKAVFFETVSNPTLEVIDIAGRRAHRPRRRRPRDRRQRLRHPVFSRAVELGADVVVYSTTKHVDGQGGRWAASCWDEAVHPQDAGALRQAHRRGHVALRRLDHAQGPRDHGPPRRGPRPRRRSTGRAPGRATPRSAA